MGTIEQRLEVRRDGMDGNRHWAEQVKTDSNAKEQAAVKNEKLCSYLSQSDPILATCEGSVS